MTQTLDALPSFDVLLERAEGVAAPLTERLTALYGPLVLPDARARPGSPYVLANVIRTLDSGPDHDPLGEPGRSHVIGHSAHDRALMGILRSLVDVVVVGGGTFRAFRRHRWTAAQAYRPLTAEYRGVRDALGLPRKPLIVIVSGSGALDLSQYIFQSGVVQVLIVTTTSGAAALRLQAAPDKVTIIDVAGRGKLTMRSVIEAIQDFWPSTRILVESGPNLLAAFLAEGLLDELFITLAPMITGLAGEANGLLTDHPLAPVASLTTALVSVRMAGDYLFARYAFSRPDHS